MSRKLNSLQMAQQNIYVSIIIELKKCYCKQSGHGSSSMRTLRLCIEV